MEKHTEIITQIIVKYKEKAQALLAGDADLTEVSYHKKNDKEYGTHDSNHTNRFRVLTGIQFIEDKIPYENLIRQLLIEEIKDLETNSFQGFGDSLRLAVWLIKQFHREKDSELFLRAKNANFDTACGFSPDDIHKDYFKINIHDFNIDECIWLALDLREEGFSDELIDLWKSKHTELNEKNLNQLCFYEKSRNNTRGHLEALKSLFEFKKEHINDWDFCSLLNNIAKKQIELGLIKEAFETISSILPALMRINNWQTVGLGRFIMESCMDVVILGDKEYVLQLWEYMLPHAKTMKNMHWNLYEKAAEAAARMGDSKLSKSFMRRLEKEKKRV